MTADKSRPDSANLTDTMAVFAADTLALHAGQIISEDRGARAVPIYLSNGFSYPNADAVAARHGLMRGGYRDSGIANPTNAVLEERIAALEGGVGGIATASGEAALFLAIATLMGAGSHIVASDSLRGGPRQLLRAALPRFGIDTTFVPTRDPASWRAAIRSETRLLIGEAIGLSCLEVLDIPVIAEIAHDHGLPLLVEATLATPALLRPIAHGADLVVHAASGFLGGHGVALGGLVIDGGRFDWEHGGRFPLLTEPASDMQDIDCSEESPIAAFLLRARYQGLRDFGASLSPMNAFQILQGMETLGLRMTRHVENARAVAAWLAKCPEVATVCYPELEHHPDHACAQRLLPNGAGGVLNFALRKGSGATQTFLDTLRLFALRDQIGDAKSVAHHPASMGWPCADPAQTADQTDWAATIQLSVGLEDSADLIEDLDRAMQAVRRGR
ncbi:MAG TPA: PLP-dependent transferase [Rhodocyclaceae bacterium]|nr:PLP-dependent transferase [Rhodocyclaceae bacterium]